MAVIVNAESGIAENLPDDQAGQALQAGTHHVPLKDAQGNLTSAHISDAPGLMQQGYTQPEPAELHDMMRYAKYSSTSQQAMTALEGAGVSQSFGVSTAIERAAGAGISALMGEKYGTTPEDIQGRADVNPGIHALGEMGGLGLSMLYGAGEANLLGKAGKFATGLVPGLAGASEAASAASGIGGFAARTGIGAVKGLVSGAAETALMEAGDEVSKLAMSDPDQHWETAASHIGAAALLGGEVGGALGGVFGAVSPLWNSKFGQKAGQTIEDIKGAFKADLAHPDLAAGVTEQLSARFKNITEGADKVFGSSGIKAQAISKYLPEMSDLISEQTQGLSDKFTKSLQSLREAEDPLASRFEKSLNKWQGAVTKPGVTSGEVFDASNEMKKQLQEWGKYNKNFVPLAEREFRDEAKGLAFEVRTSLEDTKVWGQAGKVQSDLNKAFSEFKPALDDFSKKFTSQLGRVPEVDAGKVNTYMNQLGKPTAELKQSMMKNFLDAADKYGQKIHEMHVDLGLESPIQNSPQNLLRDTLNEKTYGAKVYETLRNKAAANLAGKAMGGAGGGALGSLVGAPGIGAAVGAGIVGPVFEKVLPGIIKPLLEKASNSRGFKAAIDMGIAAAKGESRLNTAVKKVFEAGKLGSQEADLSSKFKIETLKSRLDEVQKDPKKLLEVGGDVGHYLPDHHAAMSATAARAVQYLQTLKPNTDKTSPLDSDKKVNSTQQATYDRAVGLAQQPLKAMDYMRSGRLNSQDMKTLSAIYPGWLQRTQGKVMAEMTTQIAHGKPIPYQTRLGLSVFMGQALDSTMTPQAMQMMRPPAPQMPPQGTPKRNQSGMNKLGKSNNLSQTPNQDAEQRRMQR